MDLISLGTVTETIFPIRELIQKAVENGAVSIIIAHNHPSGEIEPSVQDIKVTNEIDEASKMVGISLLDHIIFSQKNYFSLKSANLIKKEGR